MTRTQKLSFNRKHVADMKVCSGRFPPQAHTVQAVVGNLQTTNKKPKTLRFTKELNKGAAQQSRVQPQHRQGSLFCLRLFHYTKDSQLTALKTIRSKGLSHQEFY